MGLTKVVTRTRACLAFLGSPYAQGKASPAPRARLIRTGVTVGLRFALDKGSRAQVGR
jgi:hypothetical protein